MDEARKWTDVELERMERKINDIYTQAHDEVVESWNEYLKESGAKLADLEKEYAEAKASGDKELQSKVGRKLSQAKKEQTLLSDRYQEVAEQTAIQLSHVNETALAYINGQLPQVYAVNYNAIKKSAESVIKWYSFTVINPNVVKNLATEKRILLPYKTINGKKDIRWNLKKLNSEVLQGILQGDSMDEIAKRFQNVQNMNSASAIRNARTMVTAAENAGRWDSYDKLAKDGAIVEKFWSAAHDKKTRKWHREAAATYNPENKIPYDELFVVNGENLMFPCDMEHGATGHNVYNCRCGMFGVVVGFNFDKVKK